MNNRNFHFDTSPPLTPLLPLPTIEPLTLPRSQSQSSLRHGNVSRQSSGRSSSDSRRMYTNVSPKLPPNMEVTIAPTSDVPPVPRLPSNVSQHVPARYAQIPMRPLPSLPLPPLPVTPVSSLTTDAAHVANAANTANTSAPSVASTAPLLVPSINARPSMATRLSSWDSLDDRVRQIHGYNVPVHDPAMPPQILRQLPNGDYIRVTMATDASMPTAVPCIPPAANLPLAVETSTHRLGWRTYLQIGGSLLGASTLCIATYNLWSRLHHIDA